MDSTTFLNTPDWSNTYGSPQEFAPTGLFAPFPEGQKDSLAESTYGLFDGGRDGNGYLHAAPPSATPLRRARSTSAMPKINASPSLPARNDLSSPSSPFSDALRTPRDGQQVNSSSWFAAEQDNFLNSLAHTAPPSQKDKSSPTLYVAQLATPQSEATLQERRRCPSAQPALPSQDVNSSSRPTRGNSYQGTGTNLSLAIPEARSAPMAQQPSLEDVSQFFSEMSEILGPSAMAAISPPAAFPELPTSPAYSRPPPPSAATFQVAGVILDAEDYALYSRSPSNRFGSQWPQSAPPTQTSFNQYDNRPQHQGPRRSPPPSWQHQERHGQFSFNPEYSTSAGTFNPAYAPTRPRSAPASPDLGSGGAFAPFTHDGSFNPPPPATSHGYYPLRRGSSAGAESMPRSFPSHPQGYEQFPLPQLPPSHQFQPGQYQQLQQTPPHYRVPPPYYPSPNSAYSSGIPSYDYGPSSPSPAPSGHPSLRRMSSVPVGINLNPRPVIARKPTARGKKVANGGVSFINFSSSDATKLLNGVAPSGSSKRKRDEEEARRQQKQRVSAEGC